MLLPLPISPADALAKIIVPAFQTLPVQGMDSPQVRLMSLATAIQETGLLEREQIGGPARGLWQGQRNFVADVMHNRATDRMVWDWCDQNGITYGTTAIYQRLAEDDELACVISRFGFWCDPRPLPEIGDVMGAWNCYERVQRPGKPSYTRWRDTAYPQALAQFQGLNP